MVLSLIGFGATLAVLIPLSLGHAARSTWEAAAIVGVGFGLGGLGPIMWFAFGPGPTAIEIGPQPVSLRYGERQGQVLDVRRPGSKLKLYVYPETLPWGGVRKGSKQIIMRLMPFRNPLTAEAYGNLVEWAKREGLSIQDRPWWREGPIPRRTITIVVERRA